MFLANSAKEIKQTIKFDPYCSYKAFKKFHQRQFHQETKLEAIQFDPYCPK